MGEPKKRDKPIPLGIINFVEKACKSIPKENKEKTKKYADLLPPYRREPFKNRPVEYAIVVEGEITVILDSKEEKILKMDDVLIMLGVNHHYWANRSENACRVLFVWCAVAHHLEDIRPPRLSDKKAQEYLQGNPNETVEQLLQEYAKAFPEDCVDYKEYKKYMQENGKWTEKIHKDTEGLKAIKEDDDWAERTVREKFGEETEDDPSVDWYEKNGVNKEIFDYSKDLPYNYADHGIYPPDEETVPPFIPNFEGISFGTSNIDPNIVPQSAAFAIGSDGDITNISAGVAGINIEGSGIASSSTSEPVSVSFLESKKEENSTKTKEEGLLSPNVTSRSRSRNKKKITTS